VRKGTARDVMFKGTVNKLKMVGIAVVVLIVVIVVLQNTRVPCEARNAGLSMRRNRTGCTGLGRKKRVEI
jgi:Sec-independent protein translocase protein TatA